MKLTLNKYGNEHPITFSLHEYLNGNLCVKMYTHEKGYPEPWSDLTVNLGIKCKENCAFIDVNNNGNEIMAWLYKNRLGVPTGEIYPSGFCYYPEFKFDMDELMKYVKEGDDKNEIIC